MTTDVSVHAIPALKDNYIWTIIDKNQKQAVIVDPGDAIPVRNFLENQHLRPVAILITHHHWDHSNGIHDLKKIYDIPVFGPDENIEGITSVVRNDDHVEIHYFPVTFQVIEIPGHTLGHVAYYASGMVFCGDTLFSAGCGRLFEGTAEQMYTSLQKLAHLPADTNIYCGHEYTLNNLRFASVVEPHNEDIPTRINHVTQLREQHIPSLPSTITEELATNPFLRCHSKELITNAEKQSGRTLKTPVEIFAAVREWKDGF